MEELENQQNDVAFPQIVDRACGLDVHKKVIVACVAGTGIETETRSFKSTTRSLKELKKWLLELGVTHVMMESTGVYWKPVFNILEDARLTILIVNARHVKNVPGHKTDKGDAAWLCKLMRAGLLKGSFIPGREQRELRDLVRYRRKMVQALSAEHNRLLRIFEDANLKMSSVFSDVRGKTATAVLDAILSGVTDPAELAGLCTHWRLKNSQEDIAEAVECNLTEHHKFMINMIRENIENLAEHIAKLDAEIDLRVEPYEDQIALLCEIPGVKRVAAKELLAEIGVNMEVFPSADHLKSWAGLAPGNNESAGKRKSSHTNHGNKATKAIMTECAWCASHTKDTYLGALYRDMITRHKGKKRSLIALAAQMIAVIYHMLKDGTHYEELGPECIEQRRREAKIKYHTQKLQELNGGSTPGQESA